MELSSHLGGSSAPRRHYSKDFLLGANNAKLANKPTLSSEVLNVIQGLKLSRRTWRGKAEKIRERRRRRRRNKCKMLPSMTSIMSKVAERLDDADIDIGCITETWITPNNRNVIISRINPMYNVCSTERVGKTGGGTMVLVNKHYASSIKEIKCERVEGTEAEMTLIQITPIRKPRGYSTVYVASIYIPPVAALANNQGVDQREVSCLIKQITAAIDGGSKEISTSVPLVIICGDLNGAKTSFLCRSFNARLVNNQATRGSRLLDPIITNEASCYRCHNRMVLGSDHAQVIAIPKTKLYRQKLQKPPPKFARTGKMESTLEAIGLIEWEQIMSLPEGNPEAKFKVFYDTIQDIVDTCQPVKRCQLRNDQPWMTKEIKQLIQVRQQLLYKDQIEWSKVARRVRKMITKRKRSYYSQFSNKDNRDWWKVVAEMNGKATSQTAAAFPVEQINETFYQVWGNRKQPDLSKFIKPPKDLGTTTAAPKHVTPWMVERELGKLCTSKAPGPDGIPAKLLKAAKSELSVVIAHLINTSFRYSFVPAQWKEANIVPIPKINNPASPSDLRPIALTAIMSKVAERLIVKEILNHTKEIWKDNKQHGFLPGRNTMDALIQVIDEWEKAKDANNTVHAVFYDFAKAFDMVDHEILLTKIGKLIPEWITSWIAEYLSRRKQRVKVGNETATWKPVEAGVVQGSVLGPTLFLLYISDLNGHVGETVELIKFADDLLTFTVFKDLASDNIQQAVDGVTEWADINKMQLNAKKTLDMIINQVEKGPIAPVDLNGCPIKRVSSYKYLGLWLNDELKWDNVWETVAKKITPHIYLVKQLKRIGFKEEILVNVYRSLSLSVLRYNAPLLSAASEQTKVEMNGFQNRILRIIGISAEEAESKYSLRPVDQLLDEECVAKVKRIIADPEHQITKKLGIKNKRTRSKFIFRLPSAKTAKYQKSCLQKSLRTIRDGCKDVYTTTKVAAAPKRLNSPKVTCNVCLKKFTPRGIKQHVTKTHKKAK